MKQCMLLIAFLILFFSCTNTTKVQNLKLYNGAWDIVESSDESYAFLVNLKEYNNIIALCYIDSLGKLIQVTPIDKYYNVDVSSNYIKLIEHNESEFIFYENRPSEIKLEQYVDKTLKRSMTYKIGEKSKGALFSIGDQSVFIKSSMESDISSLYLYNYFIVDEELSVVNRGLIGFGEFFPEFMIFFNRHFYYIVDGQLFKKDMLNNVYTLFKFKNDVIDISMNSDNLAILLKKSIFILDVKEDSFKEFNLNITESDYIASSIVTMDKNTVLVNLKSDIDNTYNLFSTHGSPIKEYQYEGITVGDSYINNSKTLIFSTGDTLYLKDLKY